MNQKQKHRARVTLKRLSQYIHIQVMNLYYGMYTNDQYTDKVLEVCGRLDRDSKEMREQTEPKKPKTPPIRRHMFGKCSKVRLD